MIEKRKRGTCGSRAWDDGFGLLGFLGELAPRVRPKILVHQMNEHRTHHFTSWLVRGYTK